MGYKDPDRQREYQRVWIAARRREWLETNGPCVQCGSEDNLEVDHIDPEYKISHNVWTWAKSRRLEELAKCQVLCESCHLTKTSKHRFDETKHGREHMYRSRRCRCVECKEWKRVKSAKEYQRRKAKA